MTETSTLFRDHVTREKLLQEFGCSRRTLDRWIASRGFPRGQRTPGGWLWSRRKIEEWLKKTEAKEDRFSKI